VELFKKLLSSLFSFTFIVLLVFGTFNFQVLASSDAYKDKMIQKISKDYTKKFCNGIAFGLSKESAMNFANKENNLIFEKKKGVEGLDKQLIASEIAISVVDSCGFPLNLKGQEGINEFKNDYISMKNIVLKDN
tara:strand:- start:512 stop:913 length:402 start_codon:yes stop_codon:yes gene_type:complete